MDGEWIFMGFFSFGYFIRLVTAASWRIIPSDLDTWLVYNPHLFQPF